MKTLAAFKTPTEAIAGFKALFGENLNDADLSAKIGALSTDELLDKIKAEESLDGIYELMLAKVQANPDTVFTVGDTFDADDVDIISLIKTLSFESRVTKADTGVTTSTGRLISKAHLAKKANPAKQESINVKLMEISTLNGERFQVNRSSGGKQQRVIMTALLPNGSVTQFGVNEAFVENMIERDILTSKNSIQDKKAYVAVTVLHTNAKSTYIDYDPIAVSFAKKNGGVTVSRGGRVGALLFHENESSVFRGIIGTIDASVFTKAEEKADRKEQLDGQTKQLLEVEGMKAQAELNLLKAVKAYALENDMSLKQAAEELAILRGGL